MVDDELLNGIRLEVSGLASAESRAATERRLAQLGDPELAQQLRSMAIAEALQDDLSAAERWSRHIAVIAAFVLLAAAVAAGAARMSAVVPPALFFAAFCPYILSIKIVEPRLARRRILRGRA